MEAVQSFTDAPLTECPACSGALRKVFSAVGVVFKGSGFYKTDSRSAPKSDSKTSGDASTSTSTGDAGSTSKTETKSETKSETKPAPAKPAATAASKTA
jgi:putative FmdB family regulatory protein